MRNQGGFCGPKGSQSNPQYVFIAESMLSIVARPPTHKPLTTAPLLSTSVHPYATSCENVMGSSPMASLSPDDECTVHQAWGVGIQ